MPEAPPPRRRRPPEEIRPATLGSTARAHLRLFVWCEACQHKVEFGTDEIAVLAERHGAQTTLPDWAARLRCSACGSREVDFVVSGSMP